MGEIIYSNGDWGYYYDRTWKCYSIVWCSWGCCIYFNKEKDAKKYIKGIEK